MKMRFLFAAVALAVSFSLMTMSCSDDQIQSPQLVADSSGRQPVFAASDDTPIIGINIEGSSGPQTSILNGAIEQVDPATLTCAAVITFDDLVVGDPYGSSYDAVFESDGADFAERFAGQVRTTVSGNHDDLSGTPSNPLALQVGAAGQNINVITDTGCGADNVLDGLGPDGFPDPEAIGEGSFAVLFDFDQSEFGFNLCGGDGGTATINFFRRDGTLIDQVVLAGLGNQDYGFRRVGGVNDIAGISIHNLDGAGVGFDNLCHDVRGIEGRYALDIKPTSCPNPINPVSRGVTPVAILGTGTGDVTEIDPTTIMLEGIAPLRTSFWDVSAPVVDGDECDCSEDGPDGFTDLTMVFRTQELVAALGPIERDDILVLTLTAQLLDGTPVSLTDCMVVKGKPTAAGNH
jgi:hypothetical protein